MKHFIITPINWEVSDKPNVVGESRIATGRVWIERNNNEKDDLEKNPYLLLMTGGPFTACIFQKGDMEACKNKAQEMHEQAISQFLTPETEDRQKSIFKEGYFAGNVKVRAAGDSELMNKIILDDFNKIKDKL